MPPRRTAALTAVPLWRWEPQGFSGPPPSFINELSDLYSNDDLDERQY